MMCEREKKIGVSLKYCPMCGKTHSLDIIELVVYSGLGGKPVKYIEVFEKCEESNYQYTLSKKLEPFVSKEELV